MSDISLWYSSEDLSDEKFISAAFSWLLGREPDSYGLQYYLNKLMRGQRRELVLAEIANSSEAVGRRVRPESWQLTHINRFYRLFKNLPLGNIRWFFIPRFEAIFLPYSASLLGVSESAKEPANDLQKPAISQFVIDITNKRTRTFPDSNNSVDNIASFLTVSDFLDRRETNIIPINTDSLESFSDDIFIRFAYQWLLGRTVDADGLRTYREILAAGGSRVAIIESLLASDECLKYFKSNNITINKLLRYFPFCETNTKLIAAICGRSQVPVTSHQSGNIC